MSEKDYCDLLYKLGFVGGTLKRVLDLPGHDTVREELFVLLYDIRLLVDKAREEKIKFDEQFG